MDKNFFRFVSGFLGLVFLSLVFVFVAGFYDATMSGKIDGGYTASPKRKSPASVISTEKKYGKTGLENIAAPVRKQVLPPEYPPELE